MDARVEALIADIPSLSQQARLKVEMEKMEEYIMIFIEVLPYAAGIVFIVSKCWQSVLGCRAVEEVTD